MDREGNRPGIEVTSEDEWIDVDVDEEGEDKDKEELLDQEGWEEVAPGEEDSEEDSEEEEEDDDEAPQLVEVEDDASIQPPNKRPRRKMELDAKNNSGPRKGDKPGPNSRYSNASAPPSPETGSSPLPTSPR